MSDGGGNEKMRIKMKMDRNGNMGKFACLLRGIRVIAKWEFFQNIRSVRMIVLVAIFSLVMLGGAWGFSALLGGSGSLSLPEDVIREAMGNVFISTQVLDLDGDNVTDDVMIYTFRGNGEPASGETFKFLDIESNEIMPSGFNFTDRSGISLYYDVAPGEYMVQLYPGIGFSVFTVMTDGEPSDINLRLVPIYELDFSDISLDQGMDIDSLFSSYRQVGVFAHVVNVNGDPLDGVSIAVDGIVMGVTNSTGTLPVDLEPGNHGISAEKDGYGSALDDVKIKESKPKQSYFAGIPANLGPDFVIIFVASIASLIASLSAIVLSFDAITKERAERSLDVLLTKPFPRESVVLGKYLGITGAMTVPFLVVLLFSVWIISVVSGKWPSATVVAAYICFMIVLVAIYVAIEILISVLSRTTGTAILSGIGVWFLLNMLWGVLGLGISKLFRLELGVVSNYMYLFNPSDLFLVCLSIVSTDALISSVGAEELEGVLNVDYAFADWFFFLALALWAVLSLSLAVLVFRKKEDL